MEATQGYQRKSHPIHVRNQSPTQHDTAKKPQPSRPATGNCFNPILNQKGTLWLQGKRSYRSNQRSQITSRHEVVANNTQPSPNKKHPRLLLPSNMYFWQVLSEENRDVSVSDVPGAYINADMDDAVHVRLDDTLAKSLVIVNPSIYWKYVLNVSGKKTLRKTT